MEIELLFVLENTSMVSSSVTCGPGTVLTGGSFCALTLTWAMTFPVQKTEEGIEKAKPIEINEKIKIGSLNSFDFPPVQELNKLKSELSIPIPEQQLKKFEKLVGNDIYSKFKKLSKLKSFDKLILGVI